VEDKDIDISIKKEGKDAGKPDKSLLAMSLTVMP
jgi:hypothetical protein